jgi:hypothetical protein
MFARVTKGDVTSAVEKFCEILRQLTSIWFVNRQYQKRGLTRFVDSSPPA